MKLQVSYSFNPGFFRPAASLDSGFPDCVTIRKGRHSGQPGAAGRDPESSLFRQLNILIIKAHGYGIASPGALNIGYNSPQDPLIIGEVLRKRLVRPIELIIFDSCNMASVEVAYEFKDLASVMFASQDLMYYSLQTSEGNTYSSRPGIDYLIWC